MNSEHPTAQPTSSEPWFNSWFESPWYIRLYRHRTEEEAREAIDIVHHATGIAHGSRILDLCCGYGRHAMALAQDGFTVVGLDNSQYLIERARELYPHERVSYVVGDMRGPYPGAPFDVIVNFFTSFGYFDTHEENAGVFHTMFQALKPGGCMILDYLNAEVTRRTLVPETLSLVDGATVVQERRIEEPFVKKTITISNPCSHEQQFREQVWLYSAHELCAMAVDAGFVVDHLFGSYDATPFDSTSSPRCIVIAHRPA